MASTNFGSTILSQYRRTINTSTTDKLIAKVNQRILLNMTGTLDVM